MRKVFTAVLLLGAVLSGFAVMRLKVAISEERAAIELLALEVKEDVRATRVLEAEVAYQASPQRLQEAVIAHSPLMSARPEQRLKSLSDIPFRRGDGLVDGSINLLRGKGTGSSKQNKQAKESANNKPEKREGGV